ncbi:MAG: nickel-dependent lactate racemase [Clostridiales bacterium]|nr:nickel-dependent lactate racemase [Clostridiales bacterium]
MRIEIPYGKGTQPLNVEDSRVRGVLTPTHTEHVDADQQELVRAALASPIGSAPLHEIAKGKDKVVVITSDHTRPLPSSLTLPLYLAEIRKGNPDADITILIATGVHRSPTREEMFAKYGPAIVENEKLLVHNAGDDASLVRMATLPSGGELWLNKLVAEADLVVSEGFVEPHFFAGFSGGRKSILPGVAGRRTVLYNHNASFIHARESRQGNLQGNPIHRDMAFAAETAKLAFILNVLLDGDKRIIAAFAGDSVKAHEAACALCLQQTRVPVVEADIVVTSNGGYPLDQNIYQCVKGLTAAEACVREGGVIILSAGLGDGHGGEAFYHWFADRKDADEVMRDIVNVPAGETHMDQWQAQILARVQQKAFCIFVTEEVNRAMLEDMHMGWAPDMDAAMAMASARIGEAASVTVIPDGVGVIVSAEK